MQGPNQWNPHPTQRFIGSDAQAPKPIYAEMLDEETEESDGDNEEEEQDGTDETGGTSGRHTQQVLLRYFYCCNPLIFQQFLGFSHFNF